MSEIVDLDTNDSELVEQLAKITFEAFKENSPCRFVHRSGEFDQQYSGHRKKPFQVLAECWLYGGWSDA